MLLSIYVRLVITWLVATVCNDLCIPLDHFLFGSNPLFSIAHMCFFLPISPLSDAFRPEDEPPAYHGAYRGTVNVVKVVDHASSIVEKDASPIYYDSKPRRIAELSVKNRPYFDKRLPPFPPDANVTDSQTHTPISHQRFSASTEISGCSITKPQPDRKRSRRFFRYFR